MIVAGIDPSLTSTGVAILTDGQPVELPTHHGIRGTDSASYVKRSRRLRWECGQVMKALAGFELDLVVIESLPPANRTYFAGRDDRVVLFNALIGALDAKGIPLAFVLPSSAKAWATGRGRADKKDIVAAVNQWCPGLGITNDDEADALVLAHIAAYRLGDPMPFPIERRHPHIFDVGQWPTDSGVAQPESARRPGGATRDLTEPTTSRTKGTPWPTRAAPPGTKSSTGCNTAPTTERSKSSSSRQSQPSCPYRTPSKHEWKKS